jgi:hypothetical protein
LGQYNKCSLHVHQIALDDVLDFWQSTQTPTA